MKKNVFILIFIVIYCISCSNGSENIQQENQSSNSTESSKIDATGGDMGSKAYIISKDFVKRKLKSPSTADFPFADYKYENLGNDEHQILCYVDAQNEFGATKRMYYKLTLKYKGGDWEDINNWELIKEKYEQN